VLALASLPLVVSAEDTSISGTTTYISGTDYYPLDGVQVMAFRKAPVTSTVSHDGGEFSLDVPPGTPVQVVFMGPDLPSEEHLPALESLVAEENTRHELHVALYTISEARRQGINVYQFIDGLVRQLEATGISRNNAIMTRLISLRDKNG
jgi:hypothetical protein